MQWITKHPGAGLVKNVVVIFVPGIKAARILDQVEGLGFSYTHDLVQIVGDRCVGIQLSQTVRSVAQIVVIQNAFATAIT